MVSKLAWLYVLQLLPTPVIGTKRNILILFCKNGRFLHYQLMNFWDFL